MKYFRTLLLVATLFISFTLHAQLLQDKEQFSRADSLRGSLTPPRSYDVYYYHLDVKIDPFKQTIKGSNTIYFTAMQNMQLIQVDLFKNLNISTIRLDGNKKLKFTREYNAVFIDLHEMLLKGSTHRIKIFSGGQPTAAKRPPWDGGIIWAKDSVGQPWVAVTCQGMGASVWWPNKDHQSDEPDSMLISVTAPGQFQDISNGRLRKVSQRGKWKKYDWFVSYPINNYNVTVNIGNFAHLSDVYIPKQGGDTLTLDYYVLPQELDKAKEQFQQVKPMMDFFYKYFGPYPFVRDGYKLVQSPHLGMEHQTAVAYGNRYLNGYKGTASSEEGLKFDFIILHESAHEWWGNNITTNDIADMWVHESFGAYAEGLYVEYRWGYDAGMRYINAKKQSVANDRPIIGPFGVNHEGSTDMYDKGQLALNTLRHVIANDSLWIDILKGLNEKFRYQTIDGQQVIDYISKRAGMDLGYFFDQYFRHSQLPTLVVNLVKQGDDVKAQYHWKADVAGFKMPVKVTTGPGQWTVIHPTSAPQIIDLHGMSPDDFRIAEDQYFINLHLHKVYLVEGVEGL